MIDGETVIVGSYNLDPRSQNLNTELALVVRDRPLATEMRNLMDGHLKKSARIDARGFPEGATEPYPGVPRKKVWKLQWPRLLAPVVRGQL